MVGQDRTTRRVSQDCTVRKGIKGQSDNRGRTVRIWHLAGTGRLRQDSRDRSIDKKIWHSDCFNDFKNVYLSINGLFDDFSFQIFKK
jgi:hypothetical protein